MYLSEYDDKTSFGEIALGRSFALEMGSAIPSIDKRLSKHVETPFIVVEAEIESLYRPSR